jgi:hypothetical protein
VPQPGQVIDGSRLGRAGVDRFKGRSKARVGGGAEPGRRGLAAGWPGPQAEDHQDVEEAVQHRFCFPGSVSSIFRDSSVTTWWIGSSIVAGRDSTGGRPYQSAADVTREAVGAAQEHCAAGSRQGGVWQAVSGTRPAARSGRLAPPWTNIRQGAWIDRQERATVSPTASQSSTCHAQRIHPGESGWVFFSQVRALYRSEVVALGRAETGLVVTS